MQDVFRTPCALKVMLLCEISVARVQYSTVLGPTAEKLGLGASFACGDGSRRSFAPHRLQRRTYARRCETSLRLAIDG